MNYLTCASVLIIQINIKFHYYFYFYDYFTFTQIYNIFYFSFYFYNDSTLIQIRNIFSFFLYFSRKRSQARIFCIGLLWFWITVIETYTNLTFTFKIQEEQTGHCKVFILHWVSLNSLNQLSLKLFTFWYDWKTIVHNVLFGKFIFPS